MNFRNLNLKNVYEGFGDEIVAELTNAVLMQSTSYDRMTSFFNTDAFIAAAEGVDSLWERKGSMRLLLGIHDVPKDIALASQPVGLEDHIEKAKKQIYKDCETLTNALLINRIGTLAHMMLGDFLEVRVAIIQGGGTFHNKKLIFHSGSEFIAATGSQNETGAGLTKNHEELTLFRSWEQSIYAEEHLQGFNRIWEGRNNRITVKKLDPSFATEILGRLNKPKIAEPKQKYSTGSMLGSIFEMMKKSKEFWFFNVANAALYPHQERAVREAVSSWPIRMLLSDEVGLGKTLEAASVVSFAKRYLGVKQTVIFTPAGLRKQWQAELDNLFGIDAYIYDAATKSFVDIKGVSRFSHRQNENPLDSAPSVILVSWHLARTTWFDNDWLNKTSNQPDLVVVDEAHSARRRPKSGEGYETTKVWKFIDSFKDDIKHLLLLTATPMQLHVEEYHGLLMLLGLPKWWMSPKNFKLALHALDNTVAQPNLQTISDLVNATSASLQHVKRADDLVSASLIYLTAELQSEISIATKVRMLNEFDKIQQLALDLSPMRCMTVRNTKKALQKIGYVFPERRFVIPNLDIGRNGNQFLIAIERYLSEYHGKTEEVLGLTQGKGKAFVRSVYHQRLISSFASAQKTLERRRIQLQNFIDTNNWKGELYSDEDFDADDAFELGNRPVQKDKLENAKRYAQVEVTVIDSVANDLAQAKSDGDPKLAELVKQIQAESESSNPESMLIFSKFTDTLDHFIDDVLRSGAIQGKGYAKYTGQESYVCINGVRTLVDKNELCSSLRRGDINFVFCSDAASEGLNLQAASIIVNIDVPWNPARLEQRIGRVARLGQKALEVRIVNLWYPRTPEQQVYSRLLERLDLYNLAVGEFPDIIGESIREILEDDAGFNLTRIEGEINRLREDSDASALGKIWAKDLDGSVGQTFRRAMCELITDVLKQSDIDVLHTDEIFEFDNGFQTIRYTAEPGLPESLTANHLALDFLFKQCAPINPGALNDFCIGYCNGNPDFVSLKNNDGSFGLLSPLETVKLLRKTMLGEDVFFEILKSYRSESNSSFSDALNGAFSSRPTYGAYSATVIENQLPQEIITYKPIITSNNI